MAKKPVKKVVKKTKKKLKSNLPKEMLEKGGPGRPKGSKNRFTEIKDIIADTFFDKKVNGKKRYQEKSMTRVGFRELMQDIVKLMPKEMEHKGQIAHVHANFEDLDDRDLDELIRGVVQGTKDKNSTSRGGKSKKKTT